jgi:hypothetical protein
MPRQADELTVEEVARLLERTPRRVRQLIASHRLEARYEGEGFRKTYYLTRGTVESLREQWRYDPPRAGWRKGRKRKIASSSAE